jgi:hypothetical protein
VRAPLAPSDNAVRSSSAASTLPEYALRRRGWPCPGLACERRSRGGLVHVRTFGCRQGWVQSPAASKLPLGPPQTRNAVASRVNDPGVKRPGNLSFELKPEARWFGGRCGCSTEVVTVKSPVSNKAELKLELQVAVLSSPLPRVAGRTG